jgi:hypothetical protein
MLLGEGGFFCTKADEFGLSAPYAIVMSGDDPARKGNMFVIPVPSR